MAIRMDPFIAFETEVRNNSSQGIDGTGSQAEYVPFSPLEEYWDATRISEVLNSRPGESQNVRIETIRKRFLRIFSILVYCTTDVAFRVSYICRFINSNIDDDNLPLESPDPRVFMNGEEGRAAWAAFDKHQFLFNPISLGEDFPHNKSISDRCILPWEPGRILSEGKNNKTVVQIYRVNDTNELHKRGDIIAVKKTRLRDINGLSDPEAEETFTNEGVAYMALENFSEQAHASKYFLEYYGSFKQNGWGYVLLEYADQGSLHEFYSQNHTPHDLSEVYDLWEAMLKLLDGLTLLHHLNGEVTISILRGIHQDLKPTNVFVFKVHRGSLGYQYRFKIGDFGLSSIRLHQTIHPDNKGTTMYGAPELFILQPSFQHFDVGTTSKVDIWSLGCIYFEMLVWIVCGERGRDEFLSLRQKGNNIRATFHNRNKNLDALDEMLGLLLSRQRVFDNITEPFAERIQKSMLCLRPQDRMDAQFLSREFADLLKKAKEEGFAPGTGGTLAEGRSSRNQYHDQAAGSSNHPTTTDAPHGTFGRMSGSPDPLSGNSQDAGSSHFPRDALGMGATTNLGSQGTRPSPPGGARGQPASRVVTQLTGHRQDTSTSDAQSRAARRNTRGTVNGVLTNSHHNPNNRARPPHGDHRVSVPPSTSARPPQKPTFFTNCPHSLDIGVPTGPSGQPSGMQPYHLQDPIPPFQHPGPNQQVGFKKQIPLIGPRAALNRSSSIRTIREEPVYPRVHDILAYKGEKKEEKRKKWLGQRGSSEDLPQGYSDALKYQKNREQIFIVDNSASMFEHWNNVLETVEAISYVVKGCDPDGVELFLVSDPQKPKKAKKDATQDLVRYLKKQKRPATQNDNLELNFGQILNKVRSMMQDAKGGNNSLISLSPFSSNTRAGVSIYFLTDGIWFDDDSDGHSAIAAPILNLIKMMKRANYDRTEIMIQFIQFGNDVRGTERLVYLDDGLKAEVGVDGFDIVDRKPWDSNVWKILKGSLSRSNDNSDDQENYEGVAPLGTDSQIYVEQTPTIYTAQMSPGLIHYPHCPSQERRGGSCSCGTEG
ncbi:kinase-like domain-containing protein [Triangularia setosa]|uniref:Kinase-like domain-containing protein n=1 Tax=Triangularia setosa TaxID=2587417 RepID=A0AAN6WAX8_9PEZI|nr:kinase-like domain-containing protein [Podospora setosa]